MSDERSAVTTRRDTGRPVTALQGRTVHVWGVGGLGSWIAEFVVRAGAARVVLLDPGTVTGGLLVRQNYDESNVGQRKDLALLERLRALRDDVVVEVCRSDGEDWARELLSADLVIDATISRVMTRKLDLLAPFADRHATFAQVATDTRTGTLGIAVIAAPGSSETLTEIDASAGLQVTTDSALEGYEVFWEEPTGGDEFVPTRGCSIPTFHGSAADLAAIAGSLLNMICLHIDSGDSGVELVALPHSMVSPTRKLLCHAERPKSAAA